MVQEEKRKESKQKDKEQKKRKKRKGRKQKDRKEMEHRYFSLERKEVEEVHDNVLGEVKASYLQINMSISRE